MIYASAFDLSDAAHEALLRAQELTRLQDDLLKYLTRRKAGGWSIERDILRDGFEIGHKGKAFGFIDTEALKRDGAEASSARIIAEVKAQERARRERIG